MTGLLGVKRPLDANELPNGVSEYCLGAMAFGFRGQRRRDRALVQTGSAFTDPRRSLHVLRQIDSYRHTIVEPVLVQMSNLLGGGPVAGVEPILRRIKRVNRAGVDLPGSCQFVGIGEFSCVAVYTATANAKAHNRICTNITQPLRNCLVSRYSQQRGAEHHQVGNRIVDNNPHTLASRFSRYAVQSW